MAVNIFNVFLTCLLWDNVEKYGTAVQTTADNIIRRMRPVYSVTSAADTHSPYAMIIAVGYMRVPHWNIKRTATLWLKI
jgi:hypothetical protein